MILSSLLEAVQLSKVVQLAFVDRPAEFDQFWIDLAHAHGDEIDYWHRRGFRFRQVEVRLYDDSDPARRDSPWKKIPGIYLVLYTGGIYHCMIGEHGVELLDIRLTEAVKVAS